MNIIAFGIQGIRAIEDAMVAMLSSADSEVGISVAICTYNRSSSLERTLNSLINSQIPPKVLWELLIVNNNCSDDTENIIDKYKKSLPIRRLFEKSQGVTFARTCAARAARGRYILWLDDDVLVETGWLTAYMDSFRRYPDGTFFGGAVYPKFEVPPPSWITENLEQLRIPFIVIECIRWNPIISASTAIKPVTANMAVRAEVQRDFLFNPNLGSGSGTRVLGEDTDLVDRLLTHGYSGYWVPEARVAHCFGGERQTRHYVRDYIAGVGASDACRVGIQGVPLLAGAPRWLWKRMILRWLAYRLYFCLTDSSRWVPKLIEYAYDRGMFLYFRSDGSRRSGADTS